MKATFDYAVQESPEIISFFFAPEKRLQFTAGQFIELTINHTDPDSRGVRRWFTLSSSPTDDLFSITTRIVHDSSSFKQALSALHKGDEVMLSEPMGDFVLPIQTDIPVLFVAGGIGITPFHSIAEWLRATGNQRSGTVLHAVRTEDDIIFQNAFDSTGIQLINIVSEPSPAWGGERGHLTADHIIKLGSPATQTRIYISGPETMAEALTKDLEKHGIAKSNLVTDFFPGYTSF